MPPRQGVMFRVVSARSACKPALVVVSPRPLREVPVAKSCSRVRPEAAELQTQFMGVGQRALA
eukprot:5433465-Alexandrium_andersonii.AAC.1